VMKSSKFYATSDGFTLVELMVVIAIIALTATIALPNYNKIVARSRQAEARTALSAIYTVEKSFAASTETGSYTDCLGPIGFWVAGDKRYYFVGFQRPAAVVNPLLYTDCGPSGTEQCQAYVWDAPNPSTDCSCPAAMVTATGTDCQFVSTVGVGSPPVDFSNKDAVAPN